MSKNYNSVDFIKRVLYELNPDIDTRPSTAFYDLFLKPQTYMLQPILDDATALAASQSVVNIEDMTEDEANLLIANWTISRRVGGKATGSVRFFYNSIVDVSIPEGTVVLSASGLRYLTIADVEMSKEALSLNTSGGYYYVDVLVEAEDYGNEYDALPEEIVSTESYANNVVKISNPNTISGGITNETNAQLYTRAMDAIATKNLLAKRSINTVLFESFPAIQGILTIGKNDAEMISDIVETEVDGTVYAVHIGGFADVYTNTGVSGLSESTADSTASILVPASVYRKVSITGTSNSTTVFTDAEGLFISTGIKPGNTLRIKTGVGVGDYAVASVDSETQITTTTAIQFTDTNIGYEILEEGSDWLAPVIQITQVDRLNPGTQNPTGVLLYDGREVLVDPGYMVVGEDPEIITDATNGIHCVFEREDDVWYTKLSNAGLTEVPAFNVSSSTRFARNPDLTLDSSGNISIVWESDDATAGKTDIYLRVQDTDGTLVMASAAVLADPTLSYANASIGDNPNGLSIASIKDLTNLAYTLVDISDYNSILANEIPLNPGPELGSPSLDIDNNYSYVTVSTGTDVYVLKITSTGVLAWSAISLSSGTTNTLPTIAIDSTSDIYIAWDSDGTSVYLAKTNELGVTIYNPTEMVSFNVGHVKSPRLVIDSSDKVHLAVINENLNSGDVNYLKFDSDLSPLVDVDLVQDQYNNANYVALTVDLNRRPHIVWDSYDNRGTAIYYTKRQAQDYRVISLDELRRYSMQEVLNIKVDDEYASDYLRFTYKYESNIKDIDTFVSGGDSLDRVVVASYLVRYPVPVFVDVNLEYSGSDSSALTIITDYINTSTETSISVSEIIASLPSSVAARVTTPFEIETERHNQDGTIVIQRSENIIEEPRISKFIARNIVVS